MAECGACREIIPLDSGNCPSCGVSFSGVSDEALGECGACGSLMPLDSTSCSSCGVVFVADDVIEVMSRWLKSTGLSVADLFSKFDENSDGEISSEEFKDGLLELNLADLPPSQVDRLVKAIDEDGNGVIDLEELSNTFDVDFEPAKSISNDQQETAESTDADEEEATGESDEEEDAEKSDEEDTDESDEEEDADDEDFNPEDSFRKLAEGIVAAGMTIKQAFESFDINEDGMIDGPELQKGIENIGDGLLPPQEVMAVLSTIDEDDNGLIDAMEFISALEKVAPELRPKDSTFPADWQRMLMGKKWNDIWWPIIHTGFALFAILWLVNGLGLIVDGTGGAVEFDGDSMSTTGIAPGEVYPCDPDIQESKCANTLTPLSGSESSMPAGFYWDTVLFMIMGLLGFVGSMVMHLYIVKQWRQRARELKKSSEDESLEETEEEDSQDADDEEEDIEEDDEESEDEEEISEEEDTDESEKEEETEEEDSDEEDDEDDEDEIDIGSRIGIELDGEEFFGEIIEFDDDEGTVTIIDEESGDEITGMQDEMFLE